MDAPTLKEQQYFILGYVNKGILIKIEQNGVTFISEIKTPLDAEEYIIELEKE